MGRMASQGAAAASAQALPGRVVRAFGRPASPESASLRESAAPVDENPASSFFGCRDPSSVCFSVPVYKIYLGSNFTSDPPPTTQ